MTGPLSTDFLEQRAASQRNRLHDSVHELRQHLDPQTNARNYFWRASTAAAIMALAIGYGIAGAFTD
jgi:hypothetical protein